MIDDNDLKKIQQALKDELRPVKELVEILQSKVSKLDFHQTTTSMSVRSIKDQQSVINEKLDDMKRTLDVNTGSVMERQID